MTNYHFEVIIPADKVTDTLKAGGDAKADSAKNAEALLLSALAKSPIRKARVVYLKTEEEVPVSGFAVPEEEKTGEQS